MLSDTRAPLDTSSSAMPSTEGIRALAELCRKEGVEELQAGDGVWSVRLRLDLAARQAGAQTQRPPEPDGPYVFRSQWVGVFHRVAESGAPAYAEEGQELADGDLVGVIAAMQLQHEVRVDRAGTLVRFLVPDRSAVEYGQPLLEIASGDSTVRRALGDGD
jgi:biotin carboxyl carrier protein